MHGAGVGVPPVRLLRHRYVQSACGGRDNSVNDGDNDVDDGVSEYHEEQIKMMMVMMMMMVVVVMMVMVMMRMRRRRRRRRRLHGTSPHPTSLKWLCTTCLWRLPQRTEDDDDDDDGGDDNDDAGSK